MKAVATPCMIAVPSMLIVAPSGTVKDATVFETPSLSTRVSSVTGMVALLLEVLKANTGTALYRRRKPSGLRPASPHSSSG